MQAPFRSISKKYCTDLENLLQTLSSCQLHYIRDLIMTHLWPEESLKTNRDFPFWFSVDHSKGWCFCDISFFSPDFSLDVDYLGGLPPILCLSSWVRIVLGDMGPMGDTQREIGDLPLHVCISAPIAVKLCWLRMFQAQRLSEGWCLRWNTGPGPNCAARNSGTDRCRKKRAE